nr:MAG TPA: hypothetical protein [Caudoviricetes sp.]
MYESLIIHRKRKAHRVRINLALWALFLFGYKVIIQKPQGGICGGKMGANAFNTMHYYKISSLP